MHYFFKIVLYFRFRQIIADAVAIPYLLNVIGTLDLLKCDCYKWYTCIAVINAYLVIIATFQHIYRHHHHRHFLETIAEMPILEHSFELSTIAVISSIRFSFVAGLEQANVAEAKLDGMQAWGLGGGGRLV